MPGPNESSMEAKEAKVDNAAYLTQVFAALMYYIMGPNN
jgi:hypothetical protein